MIELRRILCPVDFSEATAQAVRPAISLATEYGAELYLLHVLDFPHPHLDALGPSYDVVPYYKEMEDEAARRLDELVDEEARVYADTHVVVRRGVPFMEILKMSQDNEIDLIVMPTRGRSGVDRFLFGSVAEKIVRMAACPVLTIAPSESAPKPFTPKRILYPTDFSDYSDCALPYAVSFADRYNADLIMLHVVTLWDYDPANPEWRFPPLPEQHKAAAEEAAKKALEIHGGPGVPDQIKVDRRLVRGFDPSVEIVQTSEDSEVDLIVMATHGRTGLKHALLGSTAEKVTRYAECPVLTIKHPEHQTFVP
jgi:nucleotide-binding universal stress UspA family protein